MDCFTGASRSLGAAVPLTRPTGNHMVGQEQCHFRTPRCHRRDDVSFAACEEGRPSGSAIFKNAALCFCFLCPLQLSGIGTRHSGHFPQLE